MIGRVIKAMNTSWHPDCFHCQICDAELADTGFVRNMGRSVLQISLLTNVSKNLHRLFLLQVINPQQSHFALNNIILAD